MIEATEKIVQRNANQKDCGDGLTYFALFLYIGQVFLGLSNLPGEVPELLTALEIIKYLVLSFFLLRGVISNVRDLSFLVGYCLIGIVSLISFFVTRSTVVGEAALLVVGCWGLSFRSICKVACCAAATVITLVLTFGLLGLIGLSPIVGTSLLTGATTIKHPLGFNHQNSIGGILFCALMCFIYSKNAKMNTVEIACCLMLSLFVYGYIKSRTSAMLMVVSMVFVILLRFANGRPSMKRRFCNICLFAALVSLLLGVVLPILYSWDNSAMVLLNKLFSDRLRFANLFWHSYPLTLFGHYIEFVSTSAAGESGRSALVLDNAYMHLLIHYGIIPFIILCGSYLALLRRSICEGDTALLIIVVVVMISGLSETWMLYIGKTVVLLALFSVLRSPEQSHDLRDC